MAELKITLDILLPIFLLMGLGQVLRLVGWVSAELASGMNRLIFRLFLPVLVFNNLRDMSAGFQMDAGYALYLFLGVAGVFLLAMLLVPRFERDRRKQGVMVQGIFRTNFAVLGISLMEAMYGAAGVEAVTLALPIVIPMNNVLAVLALSTSGQGRTSPWSVAKGIVTNPLIIACALGFCLSLCHVTLPSLLDTACRQVGSVTSPLSLIVLGASLKWDGVRDNKQELIWTVLLKQLIVPVAMVGLAVALGFREAALGVMIVLFGAPGAVSSYPMADAMGGDGQLAASQVVATTVASLPTLFLLVYAGKCFGWL